MSTIKPVKRIETETEIVVPENTVAKVIETRDESGKVVNSRAEFQAQVRQNENQTNNEREIELDEIEDENFDLQSEIEITAAPPKNKLENMFSELRRIVANGEHEDGFLAAITRYPDAVNMRFNTPCAMPMDLGAFQFTSRDLFSFAGAIQERNRNSGGIFGVRVYDLDGMPTMVIPDRRRYSMHAEPREIGLTNYVVPNPPETLSNGNALASPSTGVESLMLRQMEKSDERFLMLLEQMNKPKEQSDIEKRVMEAAVTQLMNPKSTENEYSMEKTMAGIMQSAVVMQSFGEAFSKMINREPKPEAEPTAFDQIGKVLELTPVQNAIDAITNVSEQWAINKMQGQAQNVERPPQPQPPTLTPEQMQANEDMKNLINDLIDELESENKLDAANPFIQKLNADYPTQANTLIQTCKAIDFDNVAKMLAAQMNSITPNPLIPFLDVEASGRQNAFVFNERGQKLLERLQEFYNFVRTL